MSKRFADGASRLAGASGRMLGWHPEWFWNATPAELAAILVEDVSDAAPGISREQFNQMMESDRNG